jgi:hypothetical protein
MERAELNHFRKAYAGTLREEGASVDTVRIRLGHKSLDLTLAIAKSVGESQTFITQGGLGSFNDRRWLPMMALAVLYDQRFNAMRIISQLGTSHFRGKASVQLSPKSRSFLYYRGLNRSPAFSKAPLL